jgi:hypothetical protein
VAKKQRSKQSSAKAKEKADGATSSKQAGVVPAVEATTAHTPAEAALREQARTSTAAPASSEATTATEGPSALDPEARDRFASSFTPTWQVPASVGPKSVPPRATPRQDPPASLDTSRDSIPLPPLPTERPSRTFGVVALIVILIIAAGVFASTRERPEEAGSARPASQGSEP